MQFKSLKLIIGLLVVLSFSLPAWATVYLSLQPSSQEVALGSQFTVDLFLSNPTPEQLLSLNVWLTFDPTYLEVVDTDSGNWITTGINIWDNPYHSAFNWDFHGQNVANNSAGTISYGEGSFATTVLGNGTFAQIHFLTKALVSNTQINYVVSGTGGTDDTYVTGISANNILGGTTGASVNIVPEPTSLILLSSSLPGVLLILVRRKK